MAGRTRNLWIVAAATACLTTVFAGVHAREDQEATDTAAAGVQLFSGSDLFRTYCAVCHGRSAKGDGPLAESMKRRPSDLTLFAAANGGTYPAELVRKIIDGRQQVAGHGGPDMPAWGDAFKASRGGLTEAEVQARIDALVTYLEGLQVRNAGHAAPSRDVQTSLR